MSHPQLRLKLTLELVWWVATAILAVLVLFPILRVFDNYPFLFANILFIFIFVTFTRYIFLLKNTFLARLTPVKLLLIAACLPLLFYLIGQVYGFQMFLDEQGSQTLLSLKYLREQVPVTRESGLLGYIRTEMLFFGVGSVITTIIMPFRMILSIWRTYNTEDRV